MTAPLNSLQHRVLQIYATIAPRHVTAQAALTRRVLIVITLAVTTVVITAILAQPSPTRQIRQTIGTVFSTLRSLPVQLVERSASWGWRVNTIEVYLNDGTSVPPSAIAPLISLLHHHPMLTLTSSRMDRLWSLALPWLEQESVVRHWPDRLVFQAQARSVAAMGRPLISARSLILLDANGQVLSRIARDQSGTFSTGNPTRDRMLLTHDAHLIIGPRKAFSRVHELIDVVSQRPWLDDAIIEAVRTDRGQRWNWLIRRDQGAPLLVQLPEKDWPQALDAWHRVSVANQSPTWPPMAQTLDLRIDERAFLRR